MNAKLQALESAIAQTTCAVGAWSIYSGEDYVQLIWACKRDALPEMYGDEPWTEWGGNAIISGSGVRSFDDSGCEGYTDRYGDDVVAQWVQWNE